MRALVLVQRSSISSKKFDCLLRNCVYVCVQKIDLVNIAVLIGTATAEQKLMKEYIFLEEITSLKKEQLINGVRLRKINKWLSFTEQRLYIILFADK